MRITRQQLHDIINEEISSALLRAENRRLTEASDYVGSLYDVDVAELLEFAEAYISLGNAVVEQLRDILDEGEAADVNPAAVDLIQQKLGGLNMEIDQALEVWSSTHMD